MSESTLLAPSTATAMFRDRTLILPTELLAYIFVILAALHPRRPVSKKKKSGRRVLQPSDWLFVTRVCKRWRTVSLETPYLWTLLVPDMKVPWDVFIQRSKSALLSIDGRHQRPHPSLTSSCISSLIGHQHRIRELRLQGMSSQNLSELLDAFTQPLPNMSALCIECIPPRRLDDVPILPSNIISDMLPDLRELQITGIDFPRERCLASLRSFEYRAKTIAIARSRHTTADVSVIVDTLRGMPSLSNLRLHLHFVMKPPEAILHDNASRASAITLCPLPHLEKLIIKSYGQECWQIWSHLRPPSHAHVDIQCADGDQTDAISGMASAISTHLATSPALWLSITTRLNYGTWENLVLCFYAPKEPSGIVTSDQTPSHSLLLVKFDLHTSSAMELLRRLLARSSLDSVFTLTLRVAPESGWNTEFVRELFFYVRSVTRVNLGMGVAGATFAALMPSSDDHLNSDPSTFLLPALTELHCGGVDFALSLVHDDVPLQARDALTRIIEYRSSKPGTRLQRLALEYCKEWEGHTYRWGWMGVDVVVIGSEDRTHTGIDT